MDCISLLRVADLPRCADPLYGGVEAHHGGILKHLLQHVVEARQLTGLRAFELVLPEAVVIKANSIASTILSMHIG